MGEMAIVSHMKGKKHNERIRKYTEPGITTYLSRRELSSNGFDLATSSYTNDHSSSLHVEELAASSSEPLIQPPITSHFIGDEVHTAEIYWTLDCINNHSSYNSSVGKSDLFPLMFPDSAIAKQFSCSASKMAYLAAFGIAPCLSSRLLAKLKTFDEYVLLFDESLNKPLQEKQLDILVRFWNNDTISSRYFDSYFLGHARSEDLYEPIRSCCDKIGVQKILQLSMDGPNVNWKLFRNVSNDIEEETNKQMLEYWKLWSSYFAQCLQEWSQFV